MNIVVYEKKPRWTPELKRQFLDTDVEVRGVVQLSDEMWKPALATNAVLVIVLEDAVERCLQYLGRLALAVTRPRVIVVAGPATMEMEWTIRELGVNNVVADLVTGEEMADLCLRLAGRK